MSNTEHDALRRQAEEWAEKQEILRPIGKLAGFYIGRADSWVLWRQSDGYWRLLTHINTPAYALNTGSEHWSIVFYPMTDALVLRERRGAQLMLRRRGTNNWVADSTLCATVEDLQEILECMTAVSPLEAMTLLSDE